jgi:hypothetical protein
MATKEETREALYDRIAELAPKVSTPKGVNELAEAFAWLTSPAQPHGGSTQTNVSK